MCYEYMKPWLQRARPFWWLIGALFLILIPIAFVVLAFYEERKELYSAMSEVFALMTYNVDGGPNG